MKGAAEHDEIFMWKDIRIIQRTDVFKIGTDALSLGGWVAKVVSHPLNILDVGTGTGVLALMMAHYFPESKIAAIDMDNAAIELASINFRNSKWRDHLSAEQLDIFQKINQITWQYDLIVCNPPFYHQKMESSNEVNAKAKHAENSASEWIKVLVNKLNSNGDLCIVVPYIDAFHWIEAANTNSYYCRNRLNLYSFPKDEIPVRSLLHFHIGIAASEIARMNVYETINKHSQEYLDLTGIQPKKGE
ncbi:MAG: methyltransferase [Saprospiraceae bacterium]